MEGIWFPAAVFVAVYAVITFEWMNKSVAALLGVMILLVFHAVDEHTAVGLIDFETIMLLLGMMAIVAVLRKSGFFTIMSVWIAERTEGSPLRILVLFSVVTATTSAFLDNVTTVLIIVPIVIELTAGMGLDPKLFIGAVAVTPDRNVVASAGTAGIVSQCHIGRIPVYLFVNSLKFSHQSSQDQHIHRKEGAETRDGLTYSLTTYSHSLVALQLIDHVVTGTGELKPAPAV
jgi:hypothetical protein